MEKQDFVLYQGIKMIVKLPNESGELTTRPECFGEQRIGAFRPRSLGPALGPAGWYVHRLLDWIPAGLLQDQDSVVDDVVRWVVLQNDPLQQQLIDAFPKYMEGVQLQLPPLAEKPSKTKEREHHFRVMLRVSAMSPSMSGAKDQVIAEVEELMRWPSPMTIESIEGVRRVPDLGEPEFVH